jgi:hypothetical protein
MIEEPEAKASETSQKPNSSLDHRTISPPRRDRWVRQVAPAARKSSTESRLETASIEFSDTAENPSSRARASRSVGKLTPARAPAPSGSRSAPRNTSSKRARSRSNIQK